MHSGKRPHSGGLVEQKVDFIRNGEGGQSSAFFHFIGIVQGKQGESGKRAKAARVMEARFLSLDIRKDYTPGFTCVHQSELLLPDESRYNENKQGGISSPKKGEQRMKKVLAVLLALAMLSGAALAEQTYDGTGKGFGGDVSVRVTVNDQGAITGLEVTAEGETPSVGGAAIAPMTEAILAAGTAEVDTVAGATVTSSAIISAVKAALTEAGVLAGASGEIRFVPGTYTGIAGGRGGDVVATVTVSETAIETINVTGEKETIGISVMPMEVIPQEIIANQSLGVDAIAGATATSYGVINAVTDALRQAGADVDALRAVPVAHELPDAQDMHTQVAVIGGGMAGLVAAVTAAEQGAQVILVEKMPFVGGNLMLAGGGLGTVGAETVDEEDGLDRVMDYFRMVNETSERQPDYAFIEKLLPETGRAIDYLTRTFGLEHTSSDRGDYVRTNFGQGADLTASLAGILEELGATVLLNTRAEHILMENGAAMGVSVSNESGMFTITADKVILATGGASHDWDRLVAANPELNVVDFYEEAAVSSTGDGFAMLEEIGAQMDDGPFIKSAYPDVSPAFRYTFRNSPTMAAKLVVDAEGARVANEAPYNQMFLNKQLLRHASPAYYGIFDKAGTADYVLSDFEAFAPNEDNSVVVYADTIEALAEKIDIDPATLRATYDRYQSLCESGIDEDFGKDASNLVPYVEGDGFYAVRVYPASWGTIGGALTDDTFHVLSEEGETLQNLFAVGEVATSRLFGDYYFGGFSLGFYTAAGHIAAETAVAELAAQ